MVVTSKYGSLNSISSATTSWQGPQRVDCRPPARTDIGHQATLTKAFDWTFVRRLYLR
jgi:hypothetical protein